MLQTKIQKNSKLQRVFITVDSVTVERWDWMKFFDGAFGTYYMAKTGDQGYCELANVNNKDEVFNIHKEYIDCGVNAIKTNTFRANSGVFDDLNLLKSIVSEGYNIAIEAVKGTDVEVFADIGGISDDELSAGQYLQVIDLFIELGAKNYLFETLSNFTGIEAAVSEIKKRVTDSMIIVSFAVSQDGYSENGIYYKTLIDQAALVADIDSIGLNCLCGPAHLLNLASKLNHIKKPFSIMPNAGYPSTVNGRMVFQDNAEYFGDKIREISRLGNIEILGGCCGTTALHIKKAIGLVKSANGTRNEPVLPYTPHISTKPRLKMNPVMVELDPPIDCDDAFILPSVDLLRKCGVETITLADSPLSRPKADSVLMAAKLKAERNIDVLPHITCRDKNSIALRASLLGAHFFGIDKALIVTGDPLIDTGGPKSSAVFNYNSLQLISYINNLNKDIFHKRPFLIGGALNVNALNFEHELTRARQKLLNGASFLLTQPIFSENAVMNFKKARQTLDCKLYAGILPVVGYKNAVFLNNEVSGIKIPSEIIDSMKGKDKSEVKNISLNFCIEMINTIYDQADGFYIMTQMKKVSLICELINRCFYV